MPPDVPIRKEDDNVFMFVFFFINTELKEYQTEKSRLIWELRHGWLLKILQMKLNNSHRVLPLTFVVILKFQKPSQK